MFTAIGESFHRLRSINPDDKILEETKRAVSVVGQYWAKLVGQNKASPKLFNLLHIALRHQRKYHLACLAEDFVERKHQDGLRDNRRNACLLSYKDRTKNNIERRVMKTEPKVEDLNRKVDVNSKRKKTNTAKSIERQTKKQQKEEERMQKSHEFFLTHCNYNIITGKSV